MNIIFNRITCGRIFNLLFLYLIPVFSVKGKCTNRIEIEVSLTNKSESADFIQNYQTLSHQPTYEISGSQEFQIKCSSNSPVQLEFNGILYNKIVSTDSKLIVGDFKDTATYCYETQVTLFSKQEATGKYSCSSYSEKKTNSVYIFASGNETSHLLHTNSGQNILTAFILLGTNNNIILPCLSTNPKIEIKLFEDGQDITNNPKVSHSSKIGFKIVNISLENDLTYNRSYKCVESKTSYNVTVRLPHKIKNSQNISFKYLNDTNELECLGATSISVVNCSTPLECQFLDSCIRFSEQNACGFERKSCSKFNSIENNKHSCRVKFPQNFNGQVFCKNDKITLKKMFYTNFAGKLAMIDEGDFQKDDDTIIKFHEIFYEDWENGSFGFGEFKNIQCRVSKFLASSVPQIFFEYKNGSRIATEPLDEYFYPSSNSYETTVEIFPNDIVKLVCIAPKINSSTWLQTIKYIKVLDKPILKIIKTSPGLGNVAHNGSLSCSAINKNGYPGFAFSWYKVINNVTKSADGTTRNDVKEGIPSTTFFLNIPRSNNVETYIYKCKASNPEAGGSWAEKYFKLISSADSLKLINVTDNMPVDDDWKQESRRPLSKAEIPMERLVIITTGCLVVLLCSAKIVKRIYIQIKQMNDPNHRALKKIIKRFYTGNMDNDSNVSNIFQGEQIIKRITDAPFKKEYKISNRNFKMGKELGTGEFGVANKAVLYNNWISRFRKTGKVVAVKMLRHDKPISQSNFENFLLEIKLWQYVGNHPNIVKYLGSVASEKNLIKMDAKLILEYCALDDLKKYLTKKYNKNNLSSEMKIQAPTDKGYCSVGESNVKYAVVKFAQNETEYEPDDSIADLIRWCYEIACGMEYLIQKKILHRDLAARNVMLDSQKVAKINDFGLSKYLFKNDKPYYVQTVSNNKDTENKLPLRWLAPEAISNRRYSEASDVWSFGVTAWEIFSPNLDPYIDIPATQGTDQVGLLLDRLINKNERLECPEKASDKLYKIMLDCWHLDPSKRPCFTKLKEKLKIRLDKWNKEDSDSEISDSDSIVTDEEA